MYNVLYVLKSKARTVNGINRAIEKATGEMGLFETQQEIEDSARQGFIEFTPTKIIMYVDGDC